MQLDEYFDFDEFDEKLIPAWELYFSGQLISTADSLRHRGNILHNNLKRSFQKFFQCDNCGSLFSENTEFCTQCSNKDFNCRIIVPHQIDKNFDPKNLNHIKFYNKPDSDIQLLTEITSNISKKDVLVLVRDENQIYTRGDMSISDVCFFDKDVWYNGLRSAKIDFTSIEKRIMFYSTVIQVKLDTNNFDAAIFTLDEYITRYLQVNMCSDENTYDVNSNNVILFLLTNTDKSFSDAYFDLQSNQNKFIDKVEYAIKNINNIFRNWKELNDIVLPIEQINHGLREIKL